MRALLCALALVSSAASTADAWHHGGRRHHYHGGYYRGYPSFYLGYAPGYYPSFGIGYGYYPFSVGFSFLGGPKDPRGSVRTLVYPKETEVFVDGYYVGIADDFEGSKLRLDPGPHTITFYLPGHRLYEETIYAADGADIKIRHEMEPLAPGEPPPLRPGGSLPSAPSSTTVAEFGTLMLRTQPGDVDILVDGELWHFPSGSRSFSLHLPPGVYELEIKKDGYESFLTDVEIFPGETTAMNVHLGSP